MAHTQSERSASDRSPTSLAERVCAESALARRLLEAASHQLRLSEGQMLFCQGDPGDSMYLLLEGHLAVHLQHPDGSETLLSLLEPGAFVGEMALLTGQPRTASVLAASDAELISCSRASFERLAEEHPDELAEFTRVVVRRMQQVQLAGVLAGLFGDLDAQTVAWLQGEMEWVHLRHGEVLFREDDPSEAMYILVSGRLRVMVTQPDGIQQVVGEVAPGEAVGEMGLLSGEPRSATVTSIRESNAVRMTQEVFEELANRQPAALRRLTRLVITRQQRSLRVRESKPVRALALALVPASPDVSSLTFAEELADCLGAYGSVLTLDSTRLDGALGKPGAAQADPEHPTGLVVSAWLSEQERRTCYLLYVADGDWSPWTERCVCQADRLLLLGDACAGPGLGPVERAIARRDLPAHQELVLLHPVAASQPSGTAAWLAKRDLHTHHHVRLGDRAHMQRLARRVAGQALGLVLSGGGARGFAHAGVLRAMEEQGMEIDLIGGNSMGSLVGGVAAMDWDIQEGVKLARRFGDPKRLFDYTLPLASLTASRKLSQVVQEVYGDFRIEDLWRPFFCVSSNLTRAEVVIHRNGLLWKAVRASIAVPGLFTPILQGGDLLVDGGLLNNFPLDVMNRLCEGGTVIGSNTTPESEMTVGYQFGPSISGWQVLWSRMNPVSPTMQVPSLAGILMRSFEISGLHRVRQLQNQADLVIRPDVQSFGILDFAAYESIIERGYQAAREQLAAWRGVP